MGRNLLEKRRYLDPNASPDRYFGKRSNTELHSKIVDGEMGRWGNGEMGRWGDGGQIKLYL
ncbi:MAG: hypothetical protein F6K56_20370 [Moorea sp. SIO3G5]|nr:hypothetical protein [Moorena sp. SIO3G5]